MSVEIEGADQLTRLARQLKEAGDRGLQRELSTAINRATKPVKAALVQSASAVLPRRGGLAARVAGTKFSTRRRNSASGGGVRIVGKGNLSLWHLDRGQVRHRAADGWTIQPIAPGWWTDPTEKAAPQVRREILAAIDAVERQIVRGL